MKNFQKKVKDEISLFTNISFDMHDCFLDILLFDLWRSCIFLFSETSILINFGILSSIAVATALLGDLFIGPTLLAEFNIFKNKKVSKELEISKKLDIFKKWFIIN